MSQLLRPPGGQCPSLGDYVAGIGPADGPTAPPERVELAILMTASELSRALMD